MSIISSIIAAYRLLKWIRTEKKQLEANTEAYLTEERAKEWRLNTEKIFRALETGNGNFEKLPKPIKWFFKHTKADNRVGEFGQWFLKSNKLAWHDEVLNQPVKPYRVH